MGAIRITTDRLELTPLDPDLDAHDLHAARSDPQVWSNMGANQPPSTPDPEGMSEVLKRNGGWGWTIRLKGQPMAIGSITLFPGDDTCRSMSWWLARAYWGRGIMSEAVSAVVDHLLGLAGFRRLDAWINADNHRSLAVARNAGMIERGRMPIYYKTRTEPHQNVVMGREVGDPEPFLLSLRPTLDVTDLPATVDLLTTAIGMHTEFMSGDPPSFAGMTITPFTASQGLYLSLARGSSSIAPVRLVLTISGNVDAAADKAVAAGAKVHRPEDDSSHRMYPVELPDGHLIKLCGAKYPGLRDTP